MAEGMDMTSLEGLSPEELSALEQAIGARKQAESDPISVLAMVLEAALADIRSLREELDRVKTDFYEKVIGGIDEQYQAMTRADGLRGFGEKHGAMFAPYAEDFKRVFDGDLNEKAYEYLESLRGEEGYTDEVGEAKLAELAGQLKGKFTKPEAAPTGDAPPPEAEKKEPEPEADPEFAAIEKEIARDKARESARMKSRGSKSAA